MNQGKIFDPFGVDEDDNDHDHDHWEAFGSEPAFSAARSNNYHSPLPFQSQSRPKPPETVHIFASFREDITCLCDSLADSHYSISVDGVITAHFVTPSKQMVPFYLALKDPRNQIEHVKLSSEYANEIINDSNLMQPNQERLIRVTIPPSDATDPTKLLKYTYNQNLQPIPLNMQIKSRSSSDGICYVNITMKCNRSYQYGLHQVTVLMSIPPGIQGESMRASRDSCRWDPLKRLVVWTLTSINKGDVIEDTIQFSSSSADKYSAAGNTFNFPLLVKCSGTDHISGVDINIGMMSKDLLPGQKLEAEVSRSFSLIYRCL